MFPFSLLLLKGFNSSSCLCAEECFYFELIHYSVSCLFQIRILPSLVQWKHVMYDVKKNVERRTVDQSVMKKTYCRSRNT